VNTKHDSKHENTPGIKAAFLSAILFVAFLFCAQSASANMRCGTHLIQDGRSPGTLQVEVLRKCGRPYSQYGNTWIYVQSGGSVYRLRFTGNGDLISITREIVR
jgi:hypothetical protein